jgi:hypothetical protein
MTWPQVAVIALGSMQVIALAWIHAWQRRAVHEADDRSAQVVDAIRTNGH